MVKDVAQGRNLLTSWYKPTRVAKDMTFVCERNEGSEKDGNNFIQVAPL